MSIGKLKGRNNDLRSRLRRVRARFIGNYPRRPPDFLVIGASRSGTTTLNYMLSSHPEIFVPHGREIHFFNNESRYPAGLLSYMYDFGGYQSEPIIGEVTPDYWEKGLVYPAKSHAAIEVDDDAVRRIARDVPGIKLIVTLRDPVSRIRSTYVKSFLQKKTKSSLEDELSLEAAGKSRLMLIRRSQYHKNIQHILTLFPSHNLKLLIFEEWIRDQGHYASQLFDFLGASTDVKIPNMHKNSFDRYRSGNNKKEPDLEISLPTKKYILEATNDCRSWLESFLDRKLPWESEV